MAEIPILESSPTLQNIKRLMKEIEADEISVAEGLRGSAGARTRLRVKLATVSKLCVQARKEIPPKGKE